MPKIPGFIEMNPCDDVNGQINLAHRVDHQVIIVMDAKLLLDEDDYEWFLNNHGSKMSGSHVVDDYIFTLYDGSVVEITGINTDRGSDYTAVLHKFPKYERDGSQNICLTFVIMTMLARQSWKAVTWLQSMQIPILWSTVWKSLKKRGSKRMRTICFLRILQGTSLLYMESCASVSPKKARWKIWFSTATIMMLTKFSLSKTSPLIALYPSNHFPKFSSTHPLSNYNKQNSNIIIYFINSNTIFYNSITKFQIFSLKSPRNSAH